VAIAWKPNTRIDLDPDARKDYTFDFEAFIPTGVTLATATVTGSSGITVYDVTFFGTEVTFWVRDIAADATETATVRVTLSTGLIDDYSLKFRGKEQ
jgi:hypothetical protein